LLYEDQRIDTLLNGLIIVENKSVESILPVHEAQLLTYMKLSGCKIGFLLNWNVTLMKHGIKRFVLNLPGDTPYPKRSSALK
jgi:GxxExxY protein